MTAFGRSLHIKGQPCWTRRGLAQWRTARLADDIPTIGRDQPLFTVTLSLFDRHDQPRNLEDFHFDVAEQMAKPTHTLQFCALSA